MWRYVWCVIALHWVCFWFDIVWGNFLCFVLAVLIIEIMDISKVIDLNLCFKLSGTPLGYISTKVLMVIGLIQGRLLCPYPPQGGGIEHWWPSSLPAGLLRSGKLPVLFLLTGQKSGFSPRRADSFDRFRSNLARPTGTQVRLAVPHFSSIGAGGWECDPENIKNFHFLVKSRPSGAKPLTDF